MGFEGNWSDSKPGYFHNLQLSFDSWNAEAPEI